MFFLSSSKQAKSFKRYIGFVHMYSIVECSYLFPQCLKILFPQNQGKSFKRFLGFLTYTYSIIEGLKLYATFGGEDKDIVWCTLW